MWRSGTDESPGQWCGVETEAELGCVVGWVMKESRAEEEWDDGLFGADREFVNNLVVVSDLEYEGHLECGSD